MNSEQANMVKKHIENMDDRQVVDFFEWKTSDKKGSQRYDSNGSSISGYSEFINYLNTHRTGGQEVDAVIGGLKALAIAGALPTAVFAAGGMLTTGVLYGAAMATGDWVLFTELYYGSFKIFSGTMPNTQDVNNDKLPFKLDLHLFSENLNPKNPMISGYWYRYFQE